jgi:hypothetical protein
MATDFSSSTIHLDCQSQNITASNIGEEEEADYGCSHRRKVSIEAFIDNGAVDPRQNHARSLSFRVSAPDSVYYKF